MYEAFILAAYGFWQVISRVCDTLHECAQKLTQYETQMQQ